jgi:hypothetical protein
MRINLLCKGESLNRLKKIKGLRAWVNIHPQMDFADFLFIRREFLCSMPHNFSPNKIIITNDYLTYYTYEPSSGLIAFDYLLNYRPKEFIIAGLDLFEAGQKIYYCDIKDNVSSEENQTKLIEEFTKDEILTKDLHKPDHTARKIKLQVTRHPDTKFIFYTNSVLLQEELVDLKNVELW